MKRACSYGICGKRRKILQDPPERSPPGPPQAALLHTNAVRTASPQAAPESSIPTQLPEEVVQHILKFGAGAPRCSVLKAKAYLLLEREGYRRSRIDKSKTKRNIADLYERRRDDIFGSARAIANDRHVVCKEKCNDWSSYTEKCISKTINSPFDMITPFYLVTRTIYDSIKKLFPPTAPSIPFVMTMSVLKRKTPSSGGIHSYEGYRPLIRCYSSRIDYFFGYEMALTLESVPGSDRFKLEQYTHNSFASARSLALSIASLNEYVFMLEFSVEDVEEDGSGFQEADNFYTSQIGFLEFSFAALAESEDKRFSSFRQVARGYSGELAHTRKEQVVKQW